MMRVEVSSFVAKRPAAYRQRKAMRMGRRFPLQIQKAGTERFFEIMLTSKRTILIEWGDCDPAGIVYFPRYFAIFDSCTAGLFAAAGLPYEAVANREMIVLPMVDIHAKFMIPSTFGDKVTVETSVTEFRRSSFVVRHRLCKGDLLAAECEETRVWAGKHPDDPGRLKGKPIPAEVIARFEEK
jgi:4-hydroxybenzoyl-CoA thioesterase